MVSGVGAWSRSVYAGCIWFLIWGAGPAPRLAVCKKPMMLGGHWRRCKAPAAPPGGPSPPISGDFRAVPRARPWQGVICHLFIIGIHLFSPSAGFLSKMARFTPLLVVTALVVVLVMLCQPTEVILIPRQFHLSRQILSGALQPGRKAMWRPLLLRYMLLSGEPTSVTHPKHLERIEPLFR